MDIHTEAHQARIVREFAQRSGEIERVWLYTRSGRSFRSSNPVPSFTDRDITPMGNQS